MVQKLIRGSRNVSGDHYYKMAFIFFCIIATLLIYIYALAQGFVLNWHGIKKMDIEVTYDKPTKTPQKNRDTSESNKKQNTSDNINTFTQSQPSKRSKKTKDPS